MAHFRSVFVLQVTALTLRFSVAAAEGDERAWPAETDPDAQVYFNDLALFGVPGDAAAGSGRGDSRFPSASCFFSVRSSGIGDDYSLTADLALIA